MVFVIRHMFRHKGSYHTNEAKGADSADSADAAIIVNDPAFTETIDESKKEWFIWTLVDMDTLGCSFVGIGSSWRWRPTNPGGCAEVFRDSGNHWYFSLGIKAQGAEVPGSDSVEWFIWWNDSLQCTVP